MSFTCFSTTFVKIFSEMLKHSNMKENFHAMESFLEAAEGGTWWFSLRVSEGLPLGTLVSL